MYTEFQAGAAAPASFADGLQDDDGASALNDGEQAGRGPDAGPVDNDRALHLLRRCGQRDERAFAELCGLLEGCLYRVLHRRMNDLQRARQYEADSIVNATLLKVWNAAGSFRGESTVLAWVIGIAIRTMPREYVQFYPRTLRTAAIDMRDGDDAQNDLLSELADLPADEGRSAEDVVGLWRNWEAVDRCMKRLSTVQRECIELVYIDCLKQEEVAAVQGVARTTVAKRLEFAIKNMAACVKRPHAGKRPGVAS
jgi:RNA polymerase sigma-70 factor (ECF subfamily)